jgi:DNA polymerase-1
MSNRLLLVDFSNLLFRAMVYGPPPSSPHSSVDPAKVSVTNGMLSMTLSLAATTKATHIAFAFDSLEDTFRKKLYPEYKAKRKSGMPEILVEQLPRVTQAVGKMGWARYRAPGFEADDVLAALAEQGPAVGFEHVYLVTGDKDLLGAVTDTTTLVWTAMGMKKLVFFTPALFHEQYGFSAPQHVEYKALVGDTGDGYPGCPGVGPKQARKLIETFGSLANIYASIDQVVPHALAAKLIAGEESARMSHQLAKLAVDAPVQLTDAGRIGTDDREQTILYLRALGLERIINALPLQIKAPAEEGIF